MKTQTVVIVSVLGLAAIGIIVYSLITPKVPTSPELTQAEKTNRNVQFDKSLQGQ